MALPDVQNLQHSGTLFSLLLTFLELLADEDKGKGEWGRFRLARVPRHVMLFRGRGGSGKRIRSTPSTLSILLVCVYAVFGPRLAKTTNSVGFGLWLEKFCGLTPCEDREENSAFNPEYWTVRYSPQNTQHDERS